MFNTENSNISSQLNNTRDLNRFNQKTPQSRIISTVIEFNPQQTTDGHIIDVGLIFRHLSDLGFQSLKQSNHLLTPIIKQGRLKQIRPLAIHHNDLPLRAVAKGKMTDEQLGCAKADLFSAQGEKLYSLKLNYQLQNQLQNQLQKNQHLPPHSETTHTGDTSQTNHNLYSPNLTGVIISPPIDATATCPPLSQQQCATWHNHAHNVPQDVLIEQCLALAKVFLKCKNANLDSAYVLRKVNFTSIKNALAGQELTINTHLSAQSGPFEPSFNFDCSVYANQQRIAEITIELM